MPDPSLHSAAPQDLDEVLVIGAGPAGIASAYALQQAGLPYRVIDRARRIGDTWASLYPSLKLNTSRWYSHMPGMPFPASYGIFPSGSQYHDYLQRFVDGHGFNIQLGVTVSRVSPDGQAWRVETDQGVWRVPALIVATGVFGSPVLPQIAGMDQFTGRLIHAHDFRHPDELVSQRVLVVGNGPSGVDISVAAGKVAQRTHIAIRSGISMGRRYPWGLPKHAWFMLAERLPRALCERLMRFVNAPGFDDQERYGLYKPLPGAGGITGYQGPELLEAVKAGQVQPIPAAPILFEGDSVQFSNGQRESYDAVIMATGYRPVLHEFLDIPLPLMDVGYAPRQSSCEWMTGPNGERGWPLRDVSQHPNGRQILGYPGLYLVGTFYKGKGAMYNFNLEAEVAASQIRDYLAELQTQSEVAPA